MHPRLARCLAGVVIGTAVHVDFHLARHGHGLSFGLSWHWLLAVPVFGAIAWWCARRWPAAPARATVEVALCGLALGQLLEPAAEMVIYSVTWGEVMSPARWRAFMEFAAAGLVTAAAALVAVRRAAS